MCERLPTVHRCMSERAHDTPPGTVEFGDGPSVGAIFGGFGAKGWGVIVAVIES